MFHIFEAIFKRKKFWPLVCLFCGIFLIILFTYVYFKDSEATFVGLIVGIITGSSICFFSIIVLLFNYKAFLYIENGHIKGKYHYFGKVDCYISDVKFAFIGYNTLVIELKSGKCYSISGIENPWPILYEIRRNMTFDVSENPEVLIKELERLNASKKKNILAIKKLQYAIRRSIVETSSLPFGKIFKVFASENYTDRVIVFRHNIGDSIYYIIQEFDSDFKLNKTYESKLFENFEQLSNSFATMIDITEKFKK